MRNLALLTFLTLDGVMQSPSGPEEDPSGGFVHGGWAQDCWDEVMEQVAREAMTDPHDLLLGRATYDSFATSFQGADETNPVASRLNNATKYVVTSDPTTLAWNGSHGISGDVVEKIVQLEQQERPLLQVHGSWQLAQTLLSNDLVDEFRLWTFPIIVGSGKRLFARGATMNGLVLLNSSTTANGATMSIYRRWQRASGPCAPDEPLNHHRTGERIS
jgi:dihydrofolate reductase